jgi:hypothetical protein
MAVLSVFKRASDSLQSASDYHDTHSADGTPITATGYELETGILTIIINLNIHREVGVFIRMENGNLRS